MTLGVIVAGGLSRRMGGGDKALMPLAGRTLLDHVVERLAPQCAGLVLNANGDPARFARFGLAVVPDDVPDHPGPLAGILAGLGAAAQAGHAAIVTVPADMPFLPPDLVARLAAGGKAGAVAATAGRVHPIAALWPVSCAAPIRAALDRGERRVRDITEALGFAPVDWPAGTPDPFFNINTPDDLATAERVAAQAAVPDAVLDLRGLKCPLPVLHTRRKLRTMAPGTVLVVECTDPLAMLDIPNLVRETGDVLELAEARPPASLFRIRRTAGS